MRLDEVRKIIEWSKVRDARRKRLGGEDAAGSERLRVAIGVLSDVELCELCALAVLGVDGCVMSLSDALEAVELSSLSTRELRVESLIMSESLPEFLSAGLRSATAFRRHVEGVA